jgi:16S rRNA (guanine966-N2)-methyltransferase
MFSMVGQDLAGRTFLDAFGGSGLMAFEAWSRGATVTCVDRVRSTARGISAVADELDAGISVVCGDVMAIDLSPHDIVFVDPPYSQDPTPIVARLGALANAVLVVEAQSQRRLPAEVGGLSLDRRRSYGTTTLWVYRPA